MKQLPLITRILSAALLALVAFSANADITVTYFHNDLTGSPVASTNETGQVIWRKNYTPYGEASGKDRDNKVGYTGHQEDANGLVYAGARYYDPALGRFLSTDPVGFSEGNPMSFNRYAYANNNPYKFVDPDGKYAELAIEAISIGIGINSARQNFSAGNYGSAALDAAGVVLDAGLAVVPVAPGVTGLGIKAAREAGEKAVYHRLGDSAENIGKIKSSGELRGNPATNTYASDIPKVKAYKGPLPEGKKGFEFTTDAVPDSGGHPFQPTWSGNRSGVTTTGGQAKISCSVTGVNC